MLATLIVILGAAQYALSVQAIRDLMRRPRVRGQNKVLWVLGILCVPIAGAIVYNWMGPTSFVRRPVGTNVPPAPPDAGSSREGAANITSITAVKAARRRRLPIAGQTPRAHPPVRQPGGGSRPRRTGS